MRAAVFSHAAILAGVAAAHLRLPASFQSSPSDREPGAAIQLWYSVNVTVGTPPQEVSLFLSTGSRTTWVPDAEACALEEPDLCDEDEGPCSQCTGGSFNYSASSSYEQINSSGLNQLYIDGHYVLGSEFRDKIYVGDAEVTSLDMGAGDSGNFGHGELAIGPHATRLSSVTDRLAQEDTIESSAYSFWLDSNDVTSGTLLFDAINTSAFEAPLQRVDVRTSESSYTGFPVGLSVLNYTRSSGGDPVVIAPLNDLPLILVQPTDMLSNLPSSLAQKIWTLAGADYDKLSGFATVPCSGGTGDASELIIGLGAMRTATARVSFEDLIIPLDITTVGSRSDNETCLFAIQSRADYGGLSDDLIGPWSLGSLVLQNTYLVFDLVNDQIALAPTLSTSGSTKTGKVVGFPSYGAAIPESEGADARSRCDWPSGPCDPGQGYDSGGSPFTSIAAITGLVVALVAALVGFIVCLCFCYHRSHCCWRGRKKAKEEVAAAAAALAASQSEPMSEKVVYAGAVPPNMPPRPTQPAVPGQADGQLPLGCACVPVQPMQSFAPAASQAVASGAPPAGGPVARSREVTTSDNLPAPGAGSPPSSPSASPPPPPVPRGAPMDPQPAGAADSPTEVSHRERPPPPRPVSPPASPPAGPSAGPSSSSTAPAEDRAVLPPGADAPALQVAADAIPKTKGTSARP